MGGSPITLLDAPGSSSYYRLENSLIEYTYNTTAYSNLASVAYLTLSQGSVFVAHIRARILENLSNKVAHIVPLSTPNNTDLVVYQDNFSLNEALKLESWGGTSPTLGNGTIKIKLWYNIITFG